jgi:ATP-dependent DNA ligase
VLKECPATFVLFDALKVEADILIMKPYRARYEAMSAVMQNTSSDKVKLISNFTNGQELWNTIVKNDWEGIVIKDPNALYELGKRSKNFLKLKNYKQAIVTVEKTEINEAGIKITGKTVINEKEIEVECQIANATFIEIGAKQTVKYLDVVGNKLVQPTKYHP